MGFQRHTAALAAVLMASVAFQAWFLGLAPGGVKLGDPSLSSAYTEALAHGQSYLQQAPDPRVIAAKDPFGPATRGLILWDTSYFRGHFYMYFGIVPFAAFLLPWQLAFGHPPSPEVAILAFLFAGYAAYGGILVLVARWYQWRVPLPLAVCAMACIVAAGGTWPLMGRPAIFEIENAAAYFFFSAALLALASYELGARSRRSLELAALATALVMGCRPNYFPAVTVVGLWVIYRSSCAAGGGFAKLAAASRVLAPMAVVGALLAWWNYHRFGSILDFGLKHTVSSDPAEVRPLAAFVNLPYHLHRYLVGLPRIGPYFPFIEGQKESAFHLQPWQEVSNQVYGFLLVSPVIILGTVAALRLQGPVRSLILLGATAFAGNFLFLSALTMSCYRYPADFLGPLALIAAIGICADPFGSSRVRSLFKAFAWVLTAYGLAAAVAVTASVAQITELFDSRRPHAFAAMARPANLIAYGIEQLTGSGPRSLVLDLVLPSNRYGSSEPALVVGERGAQDFVYFYYAGPGLIEMGFESMGLGGTVSKPVTVDYGRSHQVEISLGSFLPPEGYPTISNIPEAELISERNTIVVAIDGAVALRATVHFHNPSAQIFIGASPFDAAFGNRFTGSITRQEWVPLRGQLRGASPEQ